MLKTKTAPPTRELSTKSSKELFKKACELIPGGVNSPVRSFSAVGSEPLFISRGKGSHIWDVDNNEYIDYVNSWGALIHGHANPQVIEQVQKVLENGTSFGAPHENEIVLAELIKKSFPNIEKVRLVNSGTEAVMTAIRLARAFTRRNKIIKFSGCYHGHSDTVLTMSGSGVATFGIPSTLGVTKNTASETITLPYNDSQLIETTLAKYSKEIAAVIIEPVVGNCGVILPREGYLRQIREATKRYKCLLIFDEVITGFRLSEGGAQELYKIIPDLTTLGKIIGGGMPIGAVGGKNEILDLLSPKGSVYQAGTLSGNPISVACGISTLKLLTKETYELLESAASFLCTELEKINKELGMNNIKINKAGSMFSIFFTDKVVYDYKSANTSDLKLFSKFFHSMLSSGIYLAPSQFESNFLSSAHKDIDIKKTVEAYKNSIQKLRD